LLAQPPRRFTFTRLALAYTLDPAIIIIVIVVIIAVGAPTPVATAGG
jgi:hypothetical protein